jgi:two-component system cell cycle response regulator
VKRLQEDLRRQNRELDEVSRTDSLTGLGNRRHVMERIPELTSAALRHRRPLAVVMIDLDHFKDINDSLGHAGGDVVLREVASRLRLVLRKEDIAGRWGGDELIALLPFTDLAAAKAVAERLWWEVRSTPVATGQGEQKVTVSIGYAAGADEPEALLEAADDALYRAKRSGRDTFCP